MNIISANNAMKDAFHADGYTGKDCVIAVIDTAMAEVGRLRGHVEFGDSYRVDANNTDDHASFIGFQLLGWAPDATILSYCVFPGGVGKTSLINSALEDVLKRAVADPGRQYFVNMSLASNFGKNVMTTSYIKMHDLIKKCNAARVPVFVAAGNDGGEQLYIYPSRFEEPICVGAATENGSVADFSVWHDQLDFLEHGTNIFGINRFGIPTFMSGTSMACPNVLGKAALLACKIKDIQGSWPTEMQLYNELKECAVDCEDAGYDKKSGFGFVDIRNTDGIYKSLDSVERPVKRTERFADILRRAKNLAKFGQQPYAMSVADAQYSRLLRFGEEGEDVRKVKDKLVELGYLAKSTKNTFGSDTLRAVKKYQADKGLQVDGVVGVITWNSLFEEVSPGEEVSEPGGDEVDISMIPENISRAHAKTIVEALRGVSEVRKNIVLDALSNAVDPDSLPEYMYSFYGRGKNLYNNDLTLNIATKSKLAAYFKNANYAPYFDNGRQEIMEEASEASGYSNTWADCSGGVVGLIKKHCATMIPGVKKIVSSGFDANANTLIAKYAKATTNPKPGDWIWKSGHIGLVITPGLACEWAGGEFGCCLSVISNRRIYSFLNRKLHKMGSWTSFGSPVFYD